MLRCPVFTVCDAHALRCGIDQMNDDHTDPLYGRDHAVLNGIATIIGKARSSCNNFYIRWNKPLAPCLISDPKAKATSHGPLLSSIISNSTFNPSKCSRTCHVTQPRVLLLWKQLKTRLRLFPMDGTLVQRYEARHGGIFQEHWAALGNDQREDTTRRIEGQNRVLTEDVHNYHRSVEELYPRRRCYRRRTV